MSKCKNKDIKEEFVDKLAEEAKATSEEVEARLDLAKNIANTKFEEKGKGYWSFVVRTTKNMLAIGAPLPRKKNNN